MKKLVLLAFLALCGCGDPYLACQGLHGDEMQLCLAKANATMAWRRNVGASLQAWGQQQTQQAQQPIPQPVTCRPIGGGAVQCF